MPIPSLPIELWDMIVKQSDITKNDLCSFVRVNHAFFDIFAPLLYANRRIRLPDWECWNSTRGPSMPFEYAGALSRPLLEKLEGSWRFRDYVRTCRVGYTNNRPLNAYANREYESLVESIILWLIQLPKINLVYLENIDCKSDWIKWLASTPSLRTITTDGISINNVVREESRKAQDDPTSSTIQSFFTTIHNISWNIIIPVILCTSLRHLHLPNGTTDVLLPAHTKNGNPVLTFLVSLQLSFLEEETVTFLQYTPNLIELKFHTRLKTQSPKPPRDWTHVVPKLETFEGCSCDIPLFTVGRPMQTLLVHDSFYNYDPMLVIATLPKRFGSMTAMRTLDWDRCKNPSYLLDYLVDNGEQLEELTINKYSSVRLKRDEMDVTTWPRRLSVGRGKEQTESYIYLGDSVHNISNRATREIQRQTSVGRGKEQTE